MVNDEHALWTFQPYLMVMVLILFGTQYWPFWTNLWPLPYPPIASPTRFKTLSVLYMMQIHYTITIQAYWCVRVMYRNTLGFPLLQSFPDMVIHGVKHRLKSKGKGFALIGLCFVCKFGRGLQFPQDNVFSLSYCAGQKSFTNLTTPWIVLCSDCAWSFAFWFNLFSPR